MMPVKFIKIIYILLSFGSLMNAQVVVKMEMPEQSEAALSATMLFEESLWNNIPNALGPMGFEISGGTPPYAFQWMQNNQVLSEEENLIFTPTAGNTYSLVIIDEHKCSVKIPFTTQSVTGVQKTDLQEDGMIAVYKSISAILEIWFNPVLTEECELALIDMNGRKIYTGTIFSNDEIQVQLEPGVYILSVKGMEVHYTMRIVVP